MVQIGHKYINVIDIEDSDLLKDLPVIAESTEEIVATQQSENFEVQSSAKLHHMAASVTNAIPPNEFQRKGNNNLFTLLYLFLAEANCSQKSFIIALPHKETFCLSPTLEAILPAKKFCRIPLCFLSLSRSCLFLSDSSPFSPMPASCSRATLPWYSTV